MATPIIDNILPVAVFGRETVTLAVLMVRADAPLSVVLSAALGFAAVRRACVATILLTVALSLFIATAIVAIARTLAEGQASGGQGDCQNGGYNCFPVAVVAIDMDRLTL